MRGLAIFASHTFQPPMHTYAAPLLASHPHQGFMHPTCSCSALHNACQSPTWAVPERTGQELEALCRAALPSPIGDVEVDLDWPGHPLVAVLWDGQGQGQLWKSRG